MADRKTHVEWPMFSNRFLCGRERTKRTRYTWLEADQVTCVVCRRKLAEKLAEQAKAAMPDPVRSHLQLVVVLARRAMAEPQDADRARALGRACDNADVLLAQLTG